VKAALKRLYALGSGRTHYSREPLKRLLARINDPHRRIPAVLVGGTNGKGRVVAALSAALSRDYRAGAFIKPHLKSIRERWRIDDKPISTDMFIRAANETCELIDATNEPISFFEANVILGALVFCEAGCEIVVWEVGLGGKEDACNLTDPILSVLTNVGLDHQAILGDTHEAIASDKAHICRPQRPLLLGPPRPGWEKAFTRYQPVVVDVCRQQGALLKQVSRPPAARWEDYLSAGAQGIPPDSQATAELALKVLRGSGFGLSVNDIAAVTHVMYRGRMEHAFLEGQPVLLDAAHNVDSLRWLAQVLRHTKPNARWPVIFGCQASRDPVLLLAELAPLVSILIPIEVPVLNPCPAKRIAQAAQQLGLAVAVPPQVKGVRRQARYRIGETTELDPPDNRTRWIESVRYGLSYAKVSVPTVICGSIYYLGEILRAFETSDIG